MALKILRGFFLMWVRLPPRAPVSYLSSRNRNSVIPMVSLLLIVGAQFFLDPPVRMAKTEARALTGTYLGFDLNTYPGDDALPILRRTFSFGGYWLSPPPGGKQNTWVGKRHLFLSQKFGFLLLYRGPQSRELKSPSQAGKRGTADAVHAAAAAKKEGFPSHAIIFLDIEEGGRLPAKYHAYLRAWADQLTRAGYRAGVYHPGILSTETNRLPP